MNYTTINGYTFETVPARTKKALYLNHMWRDTCDITLNDVYWHYSANKQNAFNYCQAVRRALKGDTGFITSHNSFIFCYAFTFADPLTGVEKIAYITPTHKYVTDLI